MNSFGKTTLSTFQLYMPIMQLFIGRQSVIMCRPNSKRNVFLEIFFTRYDHHALNFEQKRGFRRNNQKFSGSMCEKRLLTDAL